MSEPIQYILYFIMENPWVTLGIAIVLLIVLNGLRIVKQYQQGVVLTLGRFSHVLNPGINVIIPMVQQVTTVDKRISVSKFPYQDVITKDNVSVKVSASVYYRVIDAQKAVLDIKDYNDAVFNFAQTMLRSTIGSHTLDDLLTNQDRIREELANALVKRVSEWGVQVNDVEINNVDLSPDMVRAMAQEAEATRGARARVITAEGELKAAEMLARAATVLSVNPAAMQLRTLATLKEIGAEQATIIVMPVGMEMMVGPAAINQALTAKGAGTKNNE